MYRPCPTRCSPSPRWMRWRCQVKSAAIWRRGCCWAQRWEDISTMWITISNQMTRSTAKHRTCWCWRKDGDATTGKRWLVSPPERSCSQWKTSFMCLANWTNIASIILLTMWIWNWFSIISTDRVWRVTRRQTKMVIMCLDCRLWMVSGRCSSIPVSMTRRRRSAWEWTGRFHLHHAISVLWRPVWRCLRDRTCLCIAKTSLCQKVRNSSLSHRRTSCCKMWRWRRNVVISRMMTSSSRTRTMLASGHPCIMILTVNWIIFVTEAKKNPPYLNSWQRRTPCSTTLSASTCR